MRTVEPSFKTITLCETDETSSRSLLSTEWNSSELFLAYSIPYVNKRNIEQTTVDDIIIEE